MSAYEDLARELEGDPVKVAAMRALLLSRELLALPDTVAALAARVAELVRAMQLALERLDRVDTSVGSLQDWALEARWQRHLPAYLGRQFRRLRVLDPSEVSSLLDDGIEAGRITVDEAYDIGLANVVARGKRLDGTPVQLVVEVSLVVDRHDLERALRRGGLLARATGEVVQAVAGGDRATRGAMDEAPGGAVLLVVGDREAA
ncbi:MAG: hypothetical protein ACRDY2_00795 [Acidimicrobiales bacterium]